MIKSASDSKTTEASIPGLVAIDETGKNGNTPVPPDLESPRVTFDANSSGSGADSADRLMGDDAAMIAFIEHAPPTLKESVACVVFCVLLVAASSISLFYMQPHQRPIPTQFLASSGEYVLNLTINEIYQGESVSTGLLLLISIVCPFCMQALYGCIRGRSGDFFRTINTYSVAFSLCSVITEFIKTYVGYLRPIFFHQCNPDQQYQTCLGLEDEDSFGVNELSKSFVSGHASFAFCGGVLFAMFLERTIGISSVEVAVLQQIPHSSASVVAMAYRKPPGLHRLGSILALSPMVVSILIACSRLVDNVHFPADVVGGAILGASIAAYCHPIWYTDPRYLP